MDSYKNPLPTVDVVLFCRDSKHIVLVERKNPPLGWALPGGFVNEGESLEEAIKREAREEIGLDIELLEQFFTYSDPKRDPRRHVITTVFIGATEADPVAGDDAARAQVVDVDDPIIQQLVFDHTRIVNDVMLRIRSDYRRKLEHSMFGR